MGDWLSTTGYVEKHYFKADCSVCIRHCSQLMQADVRIPVPWRRLGVTAPVDRVFIGRRASQLCGVNVVR